jgi:manganese transport protein
MEKLPPSTSSASTVHAAEQVLNHKYGGSVIRRLLPFLGPAFIASVAYVDPGNFATNIQAGSAFGYKLLWVVLVSNLMAMLLQGLSAKLGIATGLNLAEHCRLHLSRPATWSLWAIMEIVAMATDLAEFIGAALAFHLLLGIPLLVGAFLTAGVTFAILFFERFGFRPIESIIAGFVGIIAVSYLIEILLGQPEWGQIGRHLLVPEFGGSEGILLASGILGATVMPHVIFLHSALMQGRIVVKDPHQQRRLFRFEIADVGIAMTIAGLVNLAMLVMAAVAFHSRGFTDLATIEDAHLTLKPLFGGAASLVFAVSLLASGLSSSTVGTSAGQVIMQGFLRRRIPVWIRRVVTMIPSLLVIGLGFDATRSLVISQVVLSFGLPFAVIPLIIFTSRKSVMGHLVNRPLTTIMAVIAAALILSLNFFLLYRLFFKG